VEGFNLKKLFATALVLLGASLLLLGCVQQQAPAPTIAPPEVTQSPQETIIPEQPTIIPTTSLPPEVPSATAEATVAPVAAGKTSCSDKSASNTCSQLKPFFCSPFSFVPIALCSKCGCPEGKTCGLDNLCK